MCVCVCMHYKNSSSSLGQKHATLYQYQLNFILDITSQMNDQIREQHGDKVRYGETSPSS